VDRMLGSLLRYLRFLGYDAVGATELGPGGPREDTDLLRFAETEGRVLLTRDRELARRGGVLVNSLDVLDQVRELVSCELVEPELRLDRCSRCNTLLRPASARECDDATYIPHRPDLSFFSCDTCKRIYWKGTHANSLADRLGRVRHRSERGFD
jgi:uncharacterized protein with PIN domain